MASPASASARILDSLEIPIVLAPLAGGPSTPELAAAVTTAGGLGFVAGGYLAADELDRRLVRTRELTRGPVAVNLFVPGRGPSDPAVYAPFATRLRAWAEREGVAIGEPRYSDDDWEAKLACVCAHPPAVVSFTFGCPEPAVLEAVRRAGAETWVTVTSPDEARFAEQSGAAVLVVQGAEAGGHRGTFADGPDDPVYALLPLLALVRQAVALPLVAAGGIAAPETVRAVREAGAAAAQVGTAFMLAPEAGTAAAHREAISGTGATVLTRAFTGRLARGIRNRFIDEHDAGAPLAYPELHYLTAPMRAQARRTGDAGLINLWAGQAHALARPRPAGETAAWLAGPA